MHYFATIDMDRCDGDVVSEVDVGYLDCDNGCIRIVQWDDPAQSYIELTPNMARKLMDALVEWDSNGN